MLRRKYTIVCTDCQPLNTNKPQKSAVSQVEISAAHSDQRLDNFLFGHLDNLPRTRVYRIIRKGEVRVNKKRCKPDYKLQVGDLVRIPPLRLEAGRDPRPGPSTGALERLERALLFENEHILVLDKPAGLAVHAGSGVAYGVIDIMRQLRPQDAIELVHRLDRDTSGCLLLAKHRAVLLAMQQTLQKRQLRKRYRALVKGRWPEQLREISHALQKFHLPNGERRMRIDADGKAALTRIEVLESGEHFSQIQLDLLTGRTHQIRVHCQAEGHPIAGDDKYGDADFNRSLRQQDIRRLMLHASSLELPPTEFTPEQVVNAALPAEFEFLTRPAHKPETVRAR